MTSSARRRISRGSKARDSSVYFTTSWHLTFLALLVLRTKRICTAVHALLDSVSAGRRRALQNQNSRISTAQFNSIQLQ
eukprot:1675203-Amphidinium_carterae.1